MPSSSSRWPEPEAGAAEFISRLVETSQRAEIVALLNSARTEQEVARIATHRVCEALDAEIAFVLAARDRRAAPVPVASTGLTADQADAVAADRQCADAVSTGRAVALRGASVGAAEVRHLVLSPWRSAADGYVVLGVARQYDEAFAPRDVALVEAITDSVGAAFERTWMAAASERQAARQAALASAAKAITTMHDRDEILARLAQDARRLVDADAVGVYLADEDGLVLAGGAGLAGGALGTGSDAKTSLCGQVARTCRPVVLHALNGDDAAGVEALGPVRAVVGVPLRRRARVDGVLAAGFVADRVIPDDDVELLGAFAELAGLGCANAEARGALERAAMLDSLTGVLNHGAFQRRLGQEIERAERADEALALALLDLDDFKTINDSFGHLSGDAVLRSVAELMRSAVRAYDHVGRFGGDEFAILLPAADETTAQRIVDRAVAAITRVPLPDGEHVTAAAGVAQRRPGEAPADLIRRADEALLELKQARGHRRGGRAVGPPEPTPTADAGAGEERRLRRLATAGNLGTRLARLLDRRAIAQTAIVELGAALVRYDRCLLVRRRDDDTLVVVAAARPRGGEHGGQGVAAVALAVDREQAGRSGDLPEAVRRCVAEGRQVLIADAGADPAYGAGQGGSQLAVPVVAGWETWGALVLQADEPRTFDADDAQLVQAIADHVGAALRTAELYHNLEQTHLGTAAALSAALEAKDLYTADHAQSIADLAVAVGRKLGLDDGAQRDLRYGAIFHDIGKIAIPDAVLNKPAALDEGEFELIRRHPVIGAEILAPVPFLSAVREVVRHDHERWDGGGYPDGLRAEEIPLGARIVLVVDAYHAMVSDRPYRRAMPEAAARAELLAHAGTQFDPAVVDALLAVLDERADATAAHKVSEAG